MSCVGRRFRHSSLFLLAPALAVLACEGDIAGLPSDDETESASQALIEPNSVILSAGFGSSTEGFSYVDDAFRGTRQPNYASGAFAANAGFTTGAVRVRLGGIDNNSISGMSGAFGRNFSLNESAVVTVTFRYRVVMSPNYETDEFVEVNMSADGTLRGPVPGSDHFVRMAGDGEGGANQDTGWHLTTVELGTLDPGTHTLRFGGYNNKKTATIEFADIFIDDINVVANPPAGPSLLFRANFNSGTDSFGYLDDQFRGSKQPNYASGVRNSTAGVNGSGALSVKLGGIDGNDIIGMSGGWRRTFSINAPANVTFNFRYHLQMTAFYETDEYSEVNVKVNSTAAGPVPGSDHFVRMAGDGDGGAVQSTGWHLGTFTVQLPAGTHTVTFGGWNNKKTNADEASTIFIDDVEATAVW